MKGYEKLKATVIDDCNKGEGCFNHNGCDKERTKCFHRYCDKFKWIVNRAKSYGEKLDLNWEDILNSWEEDRNYGYMNYYQEANQPEINSEKVRVFETIEELHKSIGDKGFRCPSCGGVSKNPYKCNSGLKVRGKTCDWKVYGLFGDLGKGIFVYVKEKLAGEDLFMPISWESQTKQAVQKMSLTMLGETAYLFKTYRK